MRPVMLMSRQGVSQSLGGPRFVLGLGSPQRIWMLYRPIRDYKSESCPCITSESMYAGLSSASSVYNMGRTTAGGTAARFRVGLFH
jgi:hypothetical protein